MGSRLHFDRAAESEADEIGKKFMNSTDVVGDMSRAYNTDLSSVRIHTDDSAAKKASQRGVDAFSTGTDIFFAKGMFDNSDPASRGLLAHELSHSMQQGIGGEGGVYHSAPLGAEQGGFKSIFRKLFSKKKGKKKPEENLWEQEKQKRLKQLDAEDAKYDQWNQELEEENEAARAAYDRGLSPNLQPVESSEENDYEIDLGEMNTKAQELGWKKYHGGKNLDFNMGTTENFFREISGSGVIKEEGSKIGRVSGDKVSKEVAMELFFNHDEETTMRVLKPFFDFSVKEYSEKYPLHKMTSEERYNVFPTIKTEMSQLIGLKQWGEKYGYPLLSEDNKKKFDLQCQKYVAYTNWTHSLFNTGKTASVSKQYEMDIKDMDDNVAFYNESPLKEKKQNVLNELGADGGVMSFEQFEQAIGDLMQKSGKKAIRIRSLQNYMPGLSYDPATDTVTSPVPLSELSALRKGDKKVLNKLANKLRGMNWRAEDGKERRAGQYDAGNEEFIADFESDFKYFGDMRTASFLLNKFGGAKFLKNQKDSGDLISRMKLAQSTFGMMSSRSNDIADSLSTRQFTQFDGTGLKPTWIKRQLLESANVMTSSGPRRGEDEKLYYSSQGYALRKMIENAKKTDPEALKDPKMREMALAVLNDGFSKLVSSYDDKSFNLMTSEAFRLSGYGDLSVYNNVLSANSDDIVGQINEYTSGKEVTDALVDECINMICDHIIDPNSPLHDMVLGSLESIQNSAHFRDKPELQSKYMMNNVMLRAIVPRFSLTNTKLCKKLMVAVNSGNSAACQRLRNLLAGE